MAILKNLTINDVGQLQLPTGTTAQRGGASSATVVNFTSIGSTSWTAPAGVTSIRLLIVGGGGGGGGDVGAGAGAGGLIYYASYPVTPGNSYPITVGAGGSGGSGGQSTATASQLGGSSSFNSIVAYGGGGGGNWSGGLGGGSNTSSQVVGSAGGGTSNVGTQAQTSNPGQGNHGGIPGYNTTPGSYEYIGASGGGGAGSVGGPGYPYDQAGGFWPGVSTYFTNWGLGNSRQLGQLMNNYMYGGDGLSFDISGTPTFYAAGGGASSDSGTYSGIGGKGGGGNGSIGGGTANAASGYGSGGGGTSSTTGGAGSQGIVIVSYNVQAGDLRYNSSTGFVEMLGANWETLGKQVYTSVSGTVTSTTSGGYSIKTFTGPGTFTLTSPGSVEVMLVGGGGGGSSIAGGGGAGGLVYQSRYRLAAGVYPVTVGTGGAGATDWYTNTQSKGNPTIFGALEAQGGGAGISYTAPVFSYRNTGIGDGGSGGGGSGGHHGYYGGPSTSRGQVMVNYGGDGTAGQGFPGGTGTHNNGSGWGAFPGPGSLHSGGGGGGAGSKGGDLSDYDARTSGGTGLMVGISGSQTYYAGGGGGGTHGPGGFQGYGVGGAPGGAGGGSPGGYAGHTPPAGAANTGGGGGGGHHPGPNISGGGGSGVVIVRHL